MTLDQPQVKAYPDSAPGPATIRLTDISKYFSGVAALEHVSVEFYAGEVHAILGENGAGKSTLMNIISGALQPSAGDIHFEGERIAAMSPQVAASLGVAIAFQHPAVLDDLSVLENFLVALPSALIDGGSPTDFARAALDQVGLDVPLRMRVDALTVAQKHLLEIARALAVHPKVLILDEPTAALDQDATDMLFGRIRDVVKAGTAVIYITHRLAELREIADRVTVLRDGKLRGVAKVSEISDADLLNLIVGRALVSAFPPKSQSRSEEIDLAVDGFSGDNFYDVSFASLRAEIIGVAGVAGNGQSELMRALAGLRSLAWRRSAEGRDGQRSRSPAQGRLHAFGPAYGGARRKSDRARERDLRRSRQIRLVGRPQPGRGRAPGDDGVSLARGEGDEP